MNKIFYIIIGILLPLFGTSLGSAFVFFIKNNINEKLNKILIGFAIGIMLAASIFSLLIPSIEMSSHYIYPTIGFICGFILLMLIDKLFDNKDMLSLSVTIHNIPEGMAVGVCFAGFLSKTISITSALMLSIGIALQNIPEGSIISIPSRIKGNGLFKSFIYGVLSGVVEPIFSILTIILLNIMVPILPFLLSFAAGTMLFVIFDDLVLEIHKDNKSFYGLFGIMIGFVLMMILDIAI